MNGHNESMMLESPFHPRLAVACQINQWEDWSGYTIPQAYTDVEQEYFALRNSTGVIDITPMMKYRITGPDAEAYLNRLVTRDISKIAVGRVGYAIWCDSQGQVMDDGTIFRLADNDYRLCAYARAIDWLMWSAMGFDVSIVDETADIAALAVQGPTSCAILKLLGCSGIENLKPFGIASFDFRGHELLISRTGFTGDLGYELWIEPHAAVALWDALFTAGKLHGIRAVGTSALEMVRIEAGFLQAGVDFVPAEEAIRTGRTRSPFELGLDWLVDFNKPIFNGRKALLQEQRDGSRYRFVYLDVAGNKPADHSFIYRGDKQIGTVTSAAWCPTAKTNLAFAQVSSEYGRLGESFEVEIYYQRELQWTRVLAPCTVIAGAVFNPPRRRQTPAPDF